MILLKFYFLYRLGPLNCLSQGSIWNAKHFGLRISQSQIFVSGITLRYLCSIPHRAPAALEALWLLRTRKTAEAWPPNSFQGAHQRLSPQCTDMGGLWAQHPAKQHTMYLRVHVVKAMPSHVEGIASASEALDPGLLCPICLPDQTGKQTAQEQWNVKNIWRVYERYIHKIWKVYP